MTAHNPDYASQSRLAELTRQILDAPETGYISVSRAQRLARRRLAAEGGGRKDIAYRDPTGEMAARNVDRQRGAA